MSDDRRPYTAGRNTDDGDFRPGRGGDDRRGFHNHSDRAPSFRDGFRRSFHSDAESGDRPFHNRLRSGQNGEESPREGRGRWNDRPRDGEGRPPFRKFRDDRRDEAFDSARGGRSSWSHRDDSREENRNFRSDRPRRDDDRGFRSDRSRRDDRPFPRDNAPQKPFGGFRDRPADSGSETHDSASRPFDRPEKPFGKPARPLGKPAFPRRDDNAPRSFDKPRSRSEQNGEGDRPRSFRREGGLGPLRDVDTDILRLIAHRARLWSRLADTSGLADKERDLRTHWEDEASKISRDPKLLRQLFTLLQDVEISEGEFGGNAFNLAPSAAPVNVSLALPASGRHVRMFAALAAASGQALTLPNVQLGSNLIECLKAFSQAGADLRWNEFPQPVCTVNAGKPVSGRGLPALDRVIHLGDDPFNLYLLVFALVSRQTRLKLIGESSLRFLNLNPLKHFLPILGCRLSGLVPGQDGLPARMEASAILPDNVQIPADLPADAAVAMMLMAPFWGKTVVIDARGHAQGQAIVDEAVAVLAQAGGTAVNDGAVLTVEPNGVSLPGTIGTEMSPALTYALLAMPAFTGGTVALQGVWPATHPTARAAESLLSSVTDLAIAEGSCTSGAATGAVTSWDFSELPSDLLGLGLALFMNALAKGQATPELPRLPARTDMDVVDDFISHFGYRRSGNDLVEDTPRAGAFAAPTAWWGIGFALASFVKRNIKLANPTMVTALVPQFWTVFNSLPEPVLARPFEQALPEQDDAPKRRRIHSNEFLAEEDLPPVVDQPDFDE